MAGATDVGRKRKVNQDSYRLEPTYNLYIVADGMGGHAGGETASRIAVETIAGSISNDRNSGVAIGPQDLLIGSIHRANSAVFQEANKTKELTGMGTTVVAMLFDSTKLYVGHVGDSRVYLWRPGLIWQLTKDHSLVNEKLKAGLITREQARGDKAKNVITRSVGFESSVLVDTYQKETSPGDVYLACSDGLSGMLPDDQIKTLLDQALGNGGDLEAACKLLIQHANENGGDDNISVILARVEN